MAIISTIVDQVHWRIYAALEGDKLIVNSPPPPASANGCGDWLAKLGWNEIENPKHIFHFYYISRHYRFR